MTKAKVGDRIRITRSEDYGFEDYCIGDEGEVTWVDNDGACVLFYGKGNNIYILDKDFVVISSKEEHPRKTGDVPKIGGVPKAGDKVRLVNKPIWVGAYKEGDIGVVVDQDSVGFSATFGYVLVALDNGVYSIPHGQYEVIENDAETSFPERKEEHRLNKDAPASSAEAIRDNILRIRGKRNDLKMEIVALDKEEADCVEKLKNLGFVLYEEASSGASKEEKTVLYADDIEEDMTDPYNWEVGDILEQHEYSFKPTFTPITLIKDGQWWTRDEDGESWGEYKDMKSTFKFHSRPL